MFSRAAHISIAHVHQGTAFEICPSVLVIHGRAPSWPPNRTGDSLKVCRKLDASRLGKIAPDFRDRVTIAVDRHLSVLVGAGMIVDELDAHGSGVGIGSGTSGDRARKHGGE